MASPDEACGMAYVPGGISWGRSAVMISSSAGSGAKSVEWYLRTVCRIELTTKTSAAEMRTGSQRESTGTIATSR
jgi:hypothetical protein